MRIELQADDEIPTEPTHARRPRRLRDELNFLLTNRIPRRLATRFMGWFSKLRTGRLTPALIAAWRCFDRELDLSDSRDSRFVSLHECFTRALRPGARPVDPDPGTIVSPADAIIGSYGPIRDGAAFQAKGFPYSISDLLGDQDLVDRYRNGYFVTLRLKSSFYHRFHAPHDGELQRVLYIAGDTWNVNPVALQRVQNLFCKNERAVLDIKMPDEDQHLTLVAVAAILVASIRVHCLPVPLNLQYRGPNAIPVQASFHRGDELGWFEHGSTILLFASDGFRMANSLTTGSRIRVGQSLLTKPAPSQPHHSQTDPERQQSYPAQSYPAQ